MVPESEEGSMPGHWRGPPTVYAARELPGRVAGTPVAGTVCVVRDGGGLPAVGGAVCGDEPGAGSVGEGAGAVSLEQRQGAPNGPG